jgi:hypothetical protein
MGFQTDTTNHTKVTKLERNVLLGRGVDLKSLTWFLVTCVLSQMYTTKNIDSINVQLWQCDYMEPRPNTFAYLQHSTFHF